MVGARLEQNLKAKEDSGFGNGNHNTNNKIFRGGCQKTSYRLSGISFHVTQQHQEQTPNLGFARPYAPISSQTPVLLDLLHLPSLRNVKDTLSSLGANSCRHHYFDSVQ